MSEQQNKKTINRSISNDLGNSGVNYNVYKTLNRFRKKNPSSSKNPFKSTSKKTAAAAAAVVNGAAASKSNSKSDEKPDAIDE